MSDLLSDLRILAERKAEARTAVLRSLQALIKNVQDLARHIDDVGEAAMALQRARVTMSVLSSGMDTLRRASATARVIEDTVRDVALAAANDKTLTEEDTNDE